MSKRIVYCADGTWETPAKQSNVYRLFKALTTSAGQMPFYDDGVGNDGGPLGSLLGGAFGTGLWDEIKEGYAAIAHVYEADDPLFLFGFSRGAFTARSLAGMIAVCGLPTKNFTDQVVDIAFKAYREKDDRQALLDQLKDFGMFDAKITMVGVWDTVGALGIPAIFGDVDPVFYGFLDTNLHPDVLNAYHALAIDEKRAEFPATLWTSAPAPGQTIEQVWFCGVHGDVGGGESDEQPGTTALADITLAWIMNKASALGLDFDKQVLAQYTLPLKPEYALDKLHSSWNILWGFWKHRPIDPKAALANSVRLRCEHDSSYRPQNLILHNGVLAPDYDTADVVSQPIIASTARR